MAANDANDEDGGLARALRALARGETGPAVEKALRMFRKHGGKATPEAAKELLESMDEPLEDPSDEKGKDRDVVTRAIAVRRGEISGDLIRASRTLREHGIDPNKYGTREDRQMVDDMRERMGTTRAATIHWEGASLVFPIIDKAEARRRLRARGEEVGAPVPAPVTDMLSGPPRFFRRGAR